MPAKCLRAARPPPYVPAESEPHRFPRHRRSVSRARAALRHQLHTWRIDDEVTFTAELLLSELATNAVRAPAPRDREIEVRFKLAGLELRLEVADASAELPVRRHAQDDEESGRGLELIEALSDGWGVMPREGVGKVVWASLSLARTG